VSFKNEVIKLSETMRLISLDDKNMVVQSRYGPSPPIKVPLEINEELSCLVAVIIGDGHLYKDKFKTTIESSNHKLLRVLAQMSKELFDIDVSIIDVIRREGKKQTHNLTLYSKAVQELMSQVFQIPRGKKSFSVRIPDYILSGNKKIRGAFVIGLLAAEGSRKGKSYVRICSASKYLLHDTKSLLKDIGIKSNIESWINQKYKKEYYSLSFKRTHLDSLMRGCRSGQTGLILSIFKKVTGDHA
jgi:intein/homing endonuclease